MSKTLYVGNDHRLTVDGLRDPDGNYVNTATVEATLLDSSGAEVAGTTWPISLAYVALSDGRYQGIIDDATELVDKRTYTLIVDAVDGVSVARWELAVKAEKRVKWTS